MRALFAAVVLLAPLVAAIDLPQPLPDSGGFAITPFVPLPAPTSIAFGNGALYATLLAGASGTGELVRVPVLATAAGLVPAGRPETVASGFSQPLGVVVGPAGEVYVAASRPGAESGRTDGVVFLVTPTGQKQVVVGGLPNGRHNTNHLRFGPDDRLYVANGNPNDNGVDGGAADVHPWSGAILSFDMTQTTPASPAIVHWRDPPTPSGVRIPETQISTHAVNADFRAKVEVLASGMRNVFGVAFGANGAYTAMNGADAPPSQDTVFHITQAGTDYRFPYCFDVGAPGAVGAGISKAASPTFPAADCAGAPKATALIGWHVCATGLDVAPAGFGGFGGDLFVGECTPFFADPAHDGISEHNTAHKVARIELAADGSAVAVHEFLDGLPLPLDVLFGPDGAMYVADASGIFRVAPVV